MCACVRVRARWGGGARWRWRGRCWEKAALGRLSRHAETGAPIPAALVDALVAAKNANVGLLTCRQLFFGVFDQTIHSREECDTAAILAKLHPQVTRDVSPPFSLSPQTHTHRRTVFAKPAPRPPLPSPSALPPKNGG